MTYKESLTQSMALLAQQPKSVFIGYNLQYGSRSYGTMKDVPDSSIVEMPVAEALMAGMSTGLSLGGYQPVLIFERHDFTLLALDQLVNHLDKITVMSRGEFKPKVIVRATVGGIKPFHPGPQHIQDFTDVYRKLFTFPVVSLIRSNQIIEEYKKAMVRDISTLLVDYRELY